MAASEVEVVPASDRDSESESEVQQTSGTSNTTVVSLLDQLKAPKPSDLSRKRKVAVNPPCGKHLCKSTNVVTAVGTVKPQQRVAEFSGEQLIVSNSKHFCQACVKNHVQICETNWSIYLA